MFFQNKFYKAVKTAQTTVEEIVKKDEAQMRKILDISKNITQALDYYNSRVHNTAALANAGRVPDLLEEIISKVSL